MKKKMNLNSKQFFSTTKKPNEQLEETNQRVQQFSIKICSQLPSINDSLNQLNSQNQSQFTQQILQNQQLYPISANSQQLQFFSCQKPDAIIDRKPLILENSQLRQTGVLKYFDILKRYGFIVMDHENKEIFFHQKDISDSLLTKEKLMQFKVGKIIRLSFAVCTYIGKYNKSKKAVDIELIE
eukprot:TRINITY_DN2371_c0_g1_i1.p2 TRINITY_DN2371_c0_g1~~TRINITY_DN2371_c0_g1_i1.p2  ORF type:complete len:183 (+),score=30.37 TRINITY_DN2371_c0_g1_i1:592-1140(+)